MVNVLPEARKWEITCSGDGFVFVFEQNINNYAQFCDKGKRQNKHMDGTRIFFPNGYVCEKVE